MGQLQQLLPLLLAAAAALAAVAPASAGERQLQQQQGAVAPLPDASLGAYLGCFPADHPLRELTALQAARETVHACPAACRAANATLLAVGPSWLCRCALATPDAARRLADDACATPDSGGVPLFYLHERESRSCQWVARVPLSQPASRPA